ncbi:MAG: sugar ABC transporter permease [Methylobacteriaceae bacterium]|nr:sugar ABC transporter permease [Methylobacteriaceae bacterium]
MKAVGRRAAYVMIAPITAFLVVMLAIPLLVDLVYAVSNVTFETIRAPSFAGLRNFALVFADRDFWNAMLFSLRFALLVTIAQVSLGLVLAIFLAPLLKAWPWLMAILMLPMMVAPALVGLMYRLILHEFAGVVPYYLYLFFGDSPSFLGAQNAFWTLVVVETLQWTPFALLILYSAYAAIPLEVREAAAIDGAGAWATLRRIELPWMGPTVLVVAFIRFIDSFRVFDNVYVLTGSGAGGNTTTVSIYIYLAFFKQDDIGLAVAASIVLLVLSFLVLAGVLRLTERRP